MSRKKAEASTKQFTSLEIEHSEIERLESLAKRLSAETGFQVSRSALIRKAISEYLEASEA